MTPYISHSKKNKKNFDILKRYNIARGGTSCNNIVRNRRLHLETINGTNCS